jgi:hypothetical protein
MPPREVSAEEAQALLDTAQTGPLTARRCCDQVTHERIWSVRKSDGSLLATVDRWGYTSEAIARMLAAAPDLAATVVSLTAERDAALRQCEELTRALTTQIARGDGAEAEAVRLTRERDHAVECAQNARAIIEGRTTPPTDAEIAAHDHAGGWWLYLPPVGQSSCACGACAGHQQPSGELPRGNVRIVASLGGGRWWALDSQRRPCAWPTTEAPDAPR